jgi:hypothetical protein
MTAEDLQHTINDKYLDGYLRGVKETADDFTMFIARKMDSDENFKSAMLKRYPRLVLIGLDKLLEEGEI